MRDGKSYIDIFGNYRDFLCYVPTNLGKEMDVLLFFENPNNHEIVSYDMSPGFCRKKSPAT